MMTPLAIPPREHILISRGVWWTMEGEDQVTTLSSGLFDKHHKDVLY